MPPPPIVKGTMNCPFPELSMPQDPELTLLNRILDEIKGMRDDFRALDSKHGELATRVTRLEEDRAVRDRSAQVRLAVVCAFGALGITAITALTGAVLSNGAKIETINSYGTAYGRAQQELIGRRLEGIEKTRR